MKVLDHLVTPQGITMLMDAVSYLHAPIVHRFLVPQNFIQQ